MIKPESVIFEIIHNSNVLIKVIIKYKELMTDIVNIMLLRLILVILDQLKVLGQINLRAPEGTISSLLS
ncbi:hypothetical protein YN1HA_9540 [Sulfurisphaera ohwakuensis]